MVIYSLITARCGSKGLKDKNILDYKGHPLLAHSIMLSKKCPLIKKTFISTDSEHYASIAEKYGAIIPFIRPKNISEDLSTDYEVFLHFFKFLSDNCFQTPNIIIHLRPTYPERNLELLTDCIQQFMNVYDSYDSLRTVMPLDKNPQKMYSIKDNQLIPFFNTYNDIKEPYNMPRQLFEQAYIHNGCIDIIKVSCIMNKKSMSGERIYPYIMNENHDIDSAEDFEKSKKNKN
jgi:CMP-N,N'-diacetyllegionaminic acid synthase